MVLVFHCGSLDYVYSKLVSERACEDVILYEFFVVLVRMSESLSFHYLSSYLLF